MALAALVELGGEPVEIAEIHAQRATSRLGHVADMDHVFRWLQRASSQHDPGLERVQYSPLLEPIRNNARYVALLVQLNLPTY